MSCSRCGRRGMSAAMCDDASCPHDAELNESIQKFHERTQEQFKRFNSSAESKPQPQGTARSDEWIRQSQQDAEVERQQKIKRANEEALEKSQLEVIANKRRLGRNLNAEEQQLLKTIEARKAQNSGCSGIFKDAAIGLCLVLAASAIFGKHDKSSTPPKAEQTDRTQNTNNKQNQTSSQKEATSNKSDIKNNTSQADRFNFSVTYAIDDDGITIRPVDINKCSNNSKCPVSSEALENSPYVKMGIQKQVCATTSILTQRNESYYIKSFASNPQLLEKEILDICSKLKIIPNKACEKTRPIECKQNITPYSFQF